MTIRTLRALSMLCSLILLVSCTLPAGNPGASSPPLNLVTVDPNATATPTPFQPAVESFTPSLTFTFIPSLTPLPTQTASATPTPAPTLTAAIGPTSAPVTSSPAVTRPQYTFYVLLDYSGHQLAVRPDHPIHQPDRYNAL